MQKMYWARLGNIMRRKIYHALKFAVVGAIVLTLSCTPAHQDDQEERSDVVAAVTETAGAGEFNNELRIELLRMAEEDQEVRVALSREGEETGQVSPELFDQLTEIDSRNTNRMREIVEQYGWPGKSIVALDGAHAAWLLVQHADADLGFQKQCLELITRAAQEGEASWQDVAYLTDRVLVAEGKEQLYGTQIDMSSGEPVPFPIENEANVNQRRKSVGLGPLEDYLRHFQE
jgi:hypothetical protein